MITKICSKCNKTLPCNSNYFHKSKEHKGGYKNICKSCVSEYMYNYYQDNKITVDKRRTPYKDTYKAKLSSRITCMKRSAKFYYEPRNHDLTTEQFINLTLTYKSCMCCGSDDNNLIPMLYKKLNHGAAITLNNTLCVCESCKRDYYKRKIISFDTWYCKSPIFNQDRYNTILNHIKKE